jgi:peroxiredoxin
LAEVQAALPQFDGLGIKVVAGNTDGEGDTGHTTADHDLSFPVAHSVGPEVVAALGAWKGVRQGRAIMQPAEFVLRPSGEVAASMYASTQLGRMDPQEILRFVKARM